MNKLVVISTRPASDMDPSKWAILDVDEALVEWLKRQTEKMASWIEPVDVDAYEKELPYHQGIWCGASHMPLYVYASIPEDIYRRFEEDTEVLYLEGEEADAVRAWQEAEGDDLYMLPSGGCKQMLLSPDGKFYFVIRDKFEEWMLSTSVVNLKGENS